MLQTHMKNSFNFGLMIIIFIALQSCNNSNKNDATENNRDTLVALQSKATETVIEHELTKEHTEELTDYIPKGYIAFDTIYGDLNKDGLEDCVLIIKGTNKEKIITDEYRGELDRNRRGILILFTKNNGYELATKNYDCFSSENEDGGVYYAPELDITIEKGKLYVSYAHGRYGYWKYTFRYGNSDFELIGYDSSDNYGPIVNRETSINFLTKKKIIKKNTNEEAEGGDEVFEETREDISLKHAIKLSEIKDFDELTFY